MRTLVLPGGAGGGSKKLEVSSDVNVVVYDKERDDGVDGVVIVEDRALAKAYDKGWRAGRKHGEDFGIALGKASMSHWRRAAITNAILLIGLLVMMVVNA